MEKLKIHTLTDLELAPFGYDKHGCSMRLDPERTVEVPIAQAEVVVMPAPLREILHPSHEGIHMNRANLKRIIDHYKIDPRRLTGFDCSDWEEDYSPVLTDPMFIRCNTKGWMKRQMPRTISWAWPVENFGDIAPPPDGGFQFDVSGHMWLSGNVRVNACQSVLATNGLKSDIVTRPSKTDPTGFYGYIERDEPERAKALKAAFKMSMHLSRVALCPRSIHYVFPYRFFEAMSAARVPILFCDDYVLPWENKIDWDACTVRFSDNQSAEAGTLIRGWLDRHTDEQILEMGRRGRKYWEEWLNRDNWSSLWTTAILESLKAEGLR